MLRCRKSSDESLNDPRSVIGEMSASFSPSFLNRLCPIYFHQRSSGLSMTIFFRYVRLSICKPSNLLNYDADLDVAMGSLDWGKAPKTTSSFINMVKLALLRPSQKSPLMLVTPSWRMIVPITVPECRQFDSSISPACSGPSPDWG